MTPFTTEHPLRLVELFAGIGAQAAALERMGVPYTSTVCEIDPKAYDAYCAIHGPAPNLGDITEVERLPECDMLTYSFPCQDLSTAGLRKGMAEGSGTRSSLLWEVGRLLDASPKPRWLVMENVAAILHAKNRPFFDRWVGRLSDMGYVSTWKVLNALDYGVPQHRERCIMVSVLGGPAYRFPDPPGRGGARLRDLMEEDPDPSLYISDELARTFVPVRQGTMTVG